MNWSKLQNEQCPEWKCNTDLTYHKNIKQYTCDKCGFGIYANTITKFMWGRKKNYKGETYKFLQEDKLNEKTTMASYYFAKNGEYPLTS